MEVGGTVLDMFKNQLLGTYIPPEYVGAVNGFITNTLGPILSQMSPDQAGALMNLILTANSRNDVEKLDAAIKAFSEKYGGHTEIFGRIDEVLTSNINTIGERLGKKRIQSSMEKIVNEKGRSVQVKLNPNLQLNLPALNVDN